MRVLADENIPHAVALLSEFGQVSAVPAAAIDRTAVKEADVLLVRSVTDVGPALLRNSAVRFVGSATTGTDHIDVDYLRRSGITFAHAPGSNAMSVVEYVLAAAVELADRSGAIFGRMVAGVIGYGNIGSRLAPRLAALGMEVLVNDPPRSEREAGYSGPFTDVSLDELLCEADLVTVHVPLTRSGGHPTEGLLDAGTSSMMKHGAWLVNTSRGGIVSERALVERRASGLLAAIVVDVWEGEPVPRQDLILASDIATPHIAGYSATGKTRGTVMLYRALCQWVGRDPGGHAEGLLTPVTPVQVEPRTNITGDPGWRSELVRQLYDITEDDRRMRSLTGADPDAAADTFRRLRTTYPDRYEWGYATVSQPIPPHQREFLEDVLCVKTRSLS